MKVRAAITVHRSREEVQQRWQSSEHRPEYLKDAEAAVTFVDAPADWGTEIHVDLDRDVPGGKLGEIVAKLVTTEPLAKVKDDLRRFKQHVETGEIARSEGSPEGEMAERKFKQRPAQPLDEAELEKLAATR
jgi:uncharacterized membrane protein